MDGSGQVARHRKSASDWLMWRLRATVFVNSSSHLVNHVAAMLFSQNITIIQIATTMRDVHETLQEHSVKFKNILGFSNEKFQEHLATCGGITPSQPTLLAGKLLKVHFKTTPKVSLTA